MDDRRPASVALVPRAPDASGGRDPLGVFGCRDCGTMVDAVSADGRCEACGGGVLIRLGGEPDADKAEALIAWARRDATQVLENRGAAVGALVGASLGVAGARLGALGLGGLFVVLYLAVLGALVGHGSALAVHRWLRPASRLLPIVDRRERRWLRRAALVWVVLPLVGVAIWWAATPEHTALAQLLRLSVGKLMALATRARPGD